MFCILCAAISAQAGKGFPRKALAVKSTARYAKPVEGTLPAGYLDKYDTCLVESLAVDSTGAAWFRITAENGNGWVHANDVRYAAELDDSHIAQRKESDEDRIRRLKTLRNHPEWPRRIVRAVRKCSICMNMTREQVKASWGAPAHVDTAFILGLGFYRAWFYHDSDAKPVVVSFVDGRVIGWSGNTGK
ncbi:MAG: hypothetical protein GF350_15880 [Chitinivibrionales bacterium]|nr:hypothetical protein [Chitinivibrionales bacterium]